MASEPNVAPSWADRAADRSPIVRRSRTRSVQQAKVIVDAARRLIREQGELTTQTLVKEAGVVLQTFYRHFASKDQLLLAVFEDMIAEDVARIEAVVRELPDPVARLHYAITSALATLGDEDVRIGPRFITAAHWRLHQIFPDEMDHATRPFAELVERELRDATAAGLLRATDPAKDAWLVMKLVMSVYHHDAFATTHEPVADIAEHLWGFCLAAFGGGPEPRPHAVPR
jgi:TetR/AcrR family transcriptional regulator